MTDSIKEIMEGKTMQLHFSSLFSSQWRKPRWLVTSMDTGQHLECFLMTSIKAESKAISENVGSILKDIGKLF